MKLTDEMRELAKRDLREKFIAAIEESPSGLTLEEIKQCFSEACKMAM